MHPLGSPHISAESDWSRRYRYNAPRVRALREAGKTGGANAVVLPGGVAVKAMCAASAPPLGGGARGIVTSFSASSRRRMIGRLMQIDWSAGAAHHVVLTWHESFGHDARHWHYLLKLWRQRLEYRYGERVAGVVWRLELVPRKSGVNKGVTAPHYHLLVCWKAGRAPRDDTFARWCSEAWTCVCEPGDGAHLVHGVDCKRVHERNGRGRLLSYLAKYMCKVNGARLVDSHTGEVLSVGRCWGTWGSPPFVVVCGLRMTREGWRQFVQAVREHGERIGSWYLAHLSEAVSGVRVYGEFEWLWQRLRLEVIEGIEVA